MVKEILFLFDAYKRNNLSKKQVIELELILKDETKREILKNIITDDYVISSANNIYNTEHNLKNILQIINTDKKPKARFLSKKRIFTVAASIALLVSISYPIFKDLLLPQDNIIEEQVVLQLSDGTQKILSTKKKIDSILIKPNSHTAWVSDGKLNYNIDENNTDNSINTLKVPYGKKFFVELSDGSEVHLNAGSTLSYPISFIGAEKRKVSLIGEAYFKVAKDSTKQFIVDAGGVQTEVLGTEFNISAYNDDSFVTTTLIEGKVNVVIGDQEHVLKINEELLWNRNKFTLNKNIVDTYNTTDWVRGELICEKTPFRNIVNKLERTHNVIIEYDDNKLGGKLFRARFKNETIEEIISYLSESYGFNYRNESKKIIIN